MLILLFLFLLSSSAPRMVNSYKRTSSPRSPTNSGELFTPAHEENVRFIHESKLTVLHLWKYKFYFTQMAKNKPCNLSQKNIYLESSKYCTINLLVPFFEDSNLCLKIPTLNSKMTKTLVYMDEYTTGCNKRSIPELQKREKLLLVTKALILVLLRLCLNITRYEWVQGATSY